MKRIIKKIKQNIVGFIIGIIITLSIGVYAATQISSNNVIYKNDITVESAINDLYSKVNSNKAIASCSGENCKCKKATILHQDTCSQTDTTNYCIGAGYATNAMITYGQIGSGKTLRPGDALDCDVNGDGTYDSETERFYYVSNYYNTETKQFESDTAVLIYYNNVSEGTANNTTPYAYHSDNKNYEGPETAKLQLPTTSQWSNVSLSNTTRAIINQEGGTTGNGGSALPNSYSYEGYAARLLTAQEVNAACNITVGSYTKGELDTCQYLMENTKFANNSLTYGYWLETPRSSSAYNVWHVNGNPRFVNDSGATSASDTGVRPAIDVSVTDIKY